jgi:arylsulfatase
MGHDGFPSGFLHDSTGFALYDLRTDPTETVDLAKSYPEVIKKLQSIADKYRHTLGDDLTGVPCKECREPARVAREK